jgi:predicted TIM-barrel fold metal-dependent hydrolase
MSSLEFPFDTTRTAASLMVRGILRRFPAVRFILSHAGGALPYLVERLDLLSRNNPQLGEHAPEGFTAECARFHVDTALSTGPAAFAALRKVIPLHHILFGTDFPFGPPGQAAVAIAALSELGLSGVEEDGIASVNARALFGALVGRGDTQRAT